MTEEKHLSQSLTDELIESFEYSSTKISYRWLEKDANFLQQFDSDLKYSFLKEIHPELFNCIFFKILDQSFAIKVVQLLKPKFVN